MLSDDRMRKSSFSPQLQLEIWSHQILTLLPQRCNLKFLISQMLSSHFHICIHFYYLMCRNHEILTLCQTEDRIETEYLAVWLNERFVRLPTRRTHHYKCWWFTAPNTMKVWDVGKTSREPKSISGDTDLSWTFWTCDLLSVHLWNDHSSLWRNAEKQNKFWRVRSREKNFTWRINPLQKSFPPKCNDFYGNWLLSTAPLLQWSNIVTALILWTASRRHGCSILSDLLL